jgi:hypothetical protein
MQPRPDPAFRTVDSGRDRPARLAVPRNLASDLAPQRDRCGSALLDPAERPHEPCPIAAVGRAARALDRFGLVWSAEAPKLAPQPDWRPAYLLELADPMRSRPRLAAARALVRIAAGLKIAGDAVPINVLRDVLCDVADR